jgi:SAM-dependent methyltransferase
MTMTKPSTITQPEQLGQLLSGLTDSAWILAAIGTLFESPLAECLREPRTLDELAARVDGLPSERIRRCLDVVVMRGLVIEQDGRYQLAPGAMHFAQPRPRATLLGEINSVLLQTAAYVDAASRATPVRGWHHVNPRLLQAQGDSSVQLATALSMRLAAALDGLDTRLAHTGARILDVGVGVASLSIALCREFPAVSVVGLDIFDVPLAIARENVSRAGLADRIDLRQLAVQDLREQEAFDLAWLPAFFLAPSTIAAAIERVHAALRPGGWLLIPTIGAHVPEEQRRVAALVLEQWGTVPEAPAITKAIGEAGFEPPRAMPTPSWLELIAAQRRR